MLFFLLLRRTLRGEVSHFFCHIEAFNYTKVPGLACLLTGLGRNCR